jgi:hypothetical protein
MDPTGALVGAVLGIIVALVGFIGYVAIGDVLGLRGVCPDCSSRFPRYRWPADWAQILQFRRTCARCGCIFDYWRRSRIRDGILPPSIPEGENPNPPHA